MPRTGLVNLIIDENLPPRWCEYLNSRGLPSTHWTSIGNAGDPDSLIFDHAIGTHSVIVTQDLDFTRILALRGSRLPSVIQLRVSSPVPEEIGPELLRVVEAHEDALVQGCLISLDNRQHRIRLLPLH